MRDSDPALTKTKEKSPKMMPVIKAIIPVKDSSCLIPKPSVVFHNLNVAKK